MRNPFRRKRPTRTVLLVERDEFGGVISEEEQEVPLSEDERRFHELQILMPASSPGQAAAHEARYGAGYRALKEKLGR